MKTNAILRIILWSLVIVILLGILLAGMGFNILRRDTTLAATMVPLDEASVTQIRSGKATAIVNVRKNPTSTSEVVGALDRGEAVEVLRTETVNGQEWGYLPDYEGWVRMEYVNVQEAVSGESAAITPVEEAIPDESAYAFGNGASAAVTQDIAQNVNIRSTPSMTGEVLGQLEPGEEIRVVRAETINGKEWAYITEPKEGWVVMEFIDIGTPAPASALAPQSDNGIHFSTQEVSRISINWASGKITVEPTDGPDIIILEKNPDSKYPMEIMGHNDKLTINFSEKTTLKNGLGLNFNFKSLRKDLTIQVPNGFSLKELELDAASTDLEVHDLTISKVEIDTASGDSTFINCNVEKLDIDSASGDVIFKGSLDKLDFDAASANFEGVFTNVPSQLTMDSMSGKLEITLPPDAGFTLTQDGMSHNFSSDFKTTSKNGSQIHGDGFCRINVDGMSSQVAIHMGDTTPTATEAPTVPSTTEASTSSTAPTASRTTHHTEPETHHPEN